jgi:hypothetical protein
VTGAVASRVQACFTTFVSTATHTHRRREDVYTKAERLASDPSRVTTTSAHGDDYWVGVVTGDHDRYAVFAVSDEFLTETGVRSGRVGCTCRAGVRRVLCSHALVAEEMRLRGGEDE